MTALFSRMSRKSSPKLRVAIAETLIRLLTRLGLKFTIAFRRRGPPSFARFVQLAIRQLSIGYGATGRR
jgi:hypothetical protein